MGYAIGGLAVGETQAQREDCTATVTGLLPANSPRYLMGVGTTRDLLEAVHRGVDMFDCILPTSLAKQRRGLYQPGTARFTARGVSHHGRAHRSRLQLPYVQNALDCIPVSSAARA